MFCRFGSADDRRPVAATAKADVSDRAIRFYVTRGLLNTPDGRGPAATYSYRHLLQLLSIKLRQMEGATKLSTSAFAEAIIANL